MANLSPVDTQKIQQILNQGKKNYILKQGLKGMLLLGMFMYLVFQFWAELPLSEWYTILPACLLIGFITGILMGFIFWSYYSKLLKDCSLTS